MTSSAWQPSPVSPSEGGALEIRRLAYADLPRVIAVERRAFPKPWSVAMFVLELSKPGGVALAAHVTGEQVAHMICSRFDTVWHIMNLAVDPDFRRRGIASALIDELLARTDGPGEQYTLEVRRSNHAAVELYRRYGFQAAGVRRRYYQDNGEDAVIMWRTEATLRGSLDDVPSGTAVALDGRP